ncbi:hypothetical protein Gohar_002868 [Gossypium harknessii]|uniref:Uncharacterized protein n=1 Tax=Gossypium harknessii TaxID=34285 RepID=A0A7J9HM79_9ROSI|nr:hypothetical protein [Gossypium harknessii]
METDLAGLILDDGKEECVAKKLEDFIGRFQEYDSKQFGKGLRNFMRIQVQLDVRRPLKRKKMNLVSPGKCTYASFQKERFDFGVRFIFEGVVVTGQSAKPLSITQDASHEGLSIRWGSFSPRELA